MEDFDGGVDFGGDTGPIDSYEEITVERLGSRLKDSMCGICVGLFLFLGSFPLLIWNEGRAVDRYDTLQEGESQTININVGEIDPANEGKLVHFSADISSSESNLTDPIFGITTEDLRFKRSISMYQWREESTTKTETKAYGKKETTTTYTYYKEWSTTVHQSNNFHVSNGHENPSDFPVSSLYLEQDAIYAGSFELPDDIVDRMDWYSPLTDEDWDVSTITDQDIREDSQVLNNHGGFYVFATSSHIQSSPSIGDAKVTFETVTPGTISVIAEQRGNTLVEWQAKDSDGSILLFQRGNITAQEMYDQAEADNATTTVLLRLLGFLIMGFGIYLMLHPLEVVADIIPFVGDIVGCGICFVAFLIAAFFSGVTIGIAWLFHHPKIGGIVLAGVFALFLGVGYCLKKRQTPSQKTEPDVEKPPVHQPTYNPEEPNKVQPYTPGSNTHPMHKPFSNTNAEPEIEL